MSKYTLTLRLISDATFGRGDGLAGYIDCEVEHDHSGLPYLRGRTLKGLLSEEVDNILFSLNHIQNPVDQRWVEAKQQLFGIPGSSGKVQAIIHFAHATLHADIQNTVQQTLKAADNRLTPADILESLSAIRSQTAIEEKSGVPVEGSLRNMRVVLRETMFYADLHYLRDLSDVERTLLSATVLAFRRAGTGRNRGRGKLVADLLGKNGKSILKDNYDAFFKEVGS
ncbi:MAG: hypothetical protein KAG66_11190 [Methylococcales bacterium]|nr:hypothetical protein [Methylococcales bacterium]